MFCNSLRTVLVIGCAIAYLAVSGLASAGPLSTDHQWLSVGANYGFNPAQNGTPTVAETGSGFIDPTSEFTDPYWQNFGVFQGGGGSTSANTLRVYSEGNSSFTRATAVVEDTYTLSGPAGSVSIEVQFSADGFIDIIQNPPFSYEVGVGSAKIEIGSSMVHSGTQSGLDINGFIVGDNFGTGIVNNQNGDKVLHYDFDLLATHTMTVATGTPFGLAFLFETHGVSGVRANGLNTGLIDFTLPEGYTLTSELGWTSPVPEPTTHVLIGLGLAGFSFARRRKSA